MCVSGVPRDGIVRVCVRIYRGVFIIQEPRSDLLFLSHARNNLFYCSLSGLPSKIITTKAFAGCGARACGRENFYESSCERERGST